MNDKAQTTFLLDLIDDRPVVLKMPDMGIKTKSETMPSTPGDLITD
jgi:hypothetical protein